MRRIKKDRNDAEAEPWNFRLWLSGGADWKVWSFALIFFVSLPPRDESDRPLTAVPVSHHAGLCDVVLSADPTQREHGILGHALADFVRPAICFCCFCHYGLRLVRRQVQGSRSTPTRQLHIRHPWSPSFGLRQLLGCPLLRNVPHMRLGSRRDTNVHGLPGQQRPWTLEESFHISDSDRRRRHRRYRWLSGIPIARQARVLARYLCVFGLQYHNCYSGLCQHGVLSEREPEGGSWRKGFRGRSELQVYHIDHGDVLILSRLEGKAGSHTSLLTLVLMLSGRYHAIAQCPPDTPELNQHTIWARPSGGLMTRSSRGRMERLAQVRNSVFEYHFYAKESPPFPTEKLE